MHEGGRAMDHRMEHDLLGTLSVPRDALYGIHTARALINFPIAHRPVCPQLVHAYGAVKCACARTNHILGHWSDEKFAAIEVACNEMMEGLLDEHVVVDALQGGAGTSTNMNVNEVLANRALQRLGRPLGCYDCVHPVEDLNLHQSTNDTYPTAVKVAAIRQLAELEGAVVRLVEAFQVKERAFAHIVKVGRTQYQDAALITLGREMGAYADCLARDRWRVYKCVERLRLVNLGGTAIGTGLGAPRAYIFQVVEQLRAATGLGLARAENLVDVTQNADLFVEVSGILKTLASNLIKIGTDLRLLGSGPDAGLGELTLPPRQAGSSIMAGKVNPVIAEAAVQAGIRTVALDAGIVFACSCGSLELNPFLPLVADSLLEMMRVLSNACRCMAEFCVEGLEANEERCRVQLENATALVTALIGELGYDRATDLARIAGESGRSVREIAIELGWLDDSRFNALISPESVMRLGSPPKETGRDATSGLVRDTPG